MQKIIICLLSIILIGGCVREPATEPAVNQHVPWSTRSQHLNKINSWEIEGTIGVRMNGGGDQVNYSWFQNDRNYNIHLLSPLGLGSARLKGDPHFVTFSSLQHTYQGKTAEEVLAKALGWYLPVSNLYYWIRGLPAPGFKAEKHFDSYYHLKVLKQQGWLIHYQRYTAVGNVDLPSKIDMAQGNLMLRIIISDWTL